MADVSGPLSGVGAARRGPLEVPQLDVEEQTFQHNEHRTKAQNSAPVASRSFSPHVHCPPVGNPRLLDRRRVVALVFCAGWRPGVLAELARSQVGAAAGAIE